MPVHTMASQRREARIEALDEAVAAVAQMGETLQARQLEAKANGRKVEARDYQSMAIQCTHVIIAIRDLKERTPET